MLKGFVKKFLIGSPLKTTFEESQSEGVFDDRFGREGVTDEEIAQVRIKRGPHFLAVVSLDSTPLYPSLHVASLPLS